MTALNKIKDYFANPSLWITLIGILIAGVTAYNKIDETATRVQKIEEDFALVKTEAGKALVDVNTDILKLRVDAVAERQLLENRILALEIELIKRENSVQDLKILEQQVFDVRVAMKAVEKDVEFLVNSHKK